MIHKFTGSYYTPAKLADFVVQHVFREISKTNKKSVSILEPSIGDGVFVRSLDQFLRTGNIRVRMVGTDINKEAVKLAESAVENKRKLSLKVYDEDFLTLRGDLSKVDLVIGNPPYVRCRSLTKKSRDLCQDIHREAKLSENKVNNIWTSFVVASEKLLKGGGMMALVLPADILQVKYAEEIRHFLEERFERLEVFALGSEDFSSVEQQTMLLFAYKKSSNKGTFFYQIEDYKDAKAKQISSNGLMVCDSKWTHYNLSYADINLLNKIRRKMSIVGDHVDTAAGIVTGANEFFILNEKEVKEYGAAAYSLPIIGRSEFVQQVDFAKVNFNALKKNGKAVNLIDLSNKRKNKKLDFYIEQGEDAGLHKRHKCSKRERWYEVPNINTIPEAFFFKRSHIHPKVVRNVAKSYVTDAAYKVNSKEGVDLKSFIRSFYTGITFIYTELLGRKYGGGVLELTPNEFRNIPMLYQECDSNEYKEFSKNMNFNELNDDILYPDWLIKKLDLSHNEIEQLKSIHDKLLSARIKAVA